MKNVSIGYDNAPFNNLGFVNLTNSISKGLKRTYTFLARWAMLAIFIGTLKAGGVGLNLTAASNVILVDRPWTPGDAEQAEDRCYRIGQEQTVTAFWVQLGLIDKEIDYLLGSKDKQIELILKGKRKTLRGLDSPAELAKELLSLILPNAPKM